MGMHDDANSEGTKQDPSGDDPLFADLLAGAKEAKAWLMESPEQRSIGEGIDAAEALGLVEHIYAMGAITVYAADIGDYDDFQNTGTFILELPQDPAARRQIFEFESRHAEHNGFDGETDRGQRFLMLRFD